MIEDDEPKRAMRDSWNQIVSLPAKTSHLTLDRKFNRAEFEKMAFGLIPESMEDKWFIFFEDLYLYFHRSWRGQCIYRVRFAEEGDFYTLAEILVNRDPEQYKLTDDRYDAAILLFLIENLLLGNQTPFPMAANSDTNHPAGVLQHNIAGTGYPEKKI